MPDLRTSESATNVFLVEQIDLITVHLPGKRNRKASIMNMQKSNQQARKAIALVHGGFVDGSGWAGVYNILKEKGYNVVVVQNPTKSLAEDVAFTKSAIDGLKSECE